MAAIKKDSPYDYVAYDEIAAAKSKAIRQPLEGIREAIGALPDSREKSLALTKLEEAFMWVGKAIRDEQLKRKPE